ncbi:mammaglobin-A-like [Sturnira hondurensis]|uniref:mammaglobin-A-like n=1 Tax=Sturnira hondurensis TaxID=192404 RepID=UPI001879EAD6|nr:mammaglobin-A-like [Sturnira hondurensis]
MKLVTILMLTALPLYCYAGSGCELMDTVMNKIVDRNISAAEFVDAFQKYIPGEETKKAIIFLKEGFLHQSDEILDKFKEMQEAIYNSFWCARY